MKNFETKITDFGVSKFETLNTTQNQKGTPSYIKFLKLIILK
jgi:hypothetical protein